MTKGTKQYVKEVMPADTWVRASEESLARIIAKYGKVVVK